MTRKLISTLALSLGIITTLFASDGANHNQAAPQLTEAKIALNHTIVEGTLQSVKNSPFIVQFFNNPSRTAEGQTFLGQINVVTNGGGNVKFKATLPPTASGTFVTATATRGTDTDPKDTSEFSKPVQVK